MKYVNRATGLLAFTLFAGACAGGTADAGEDEAWAGTMTDSAGVTMVQNPSSGLWADGYSWTLTEEMRVGGISDDPNYQFGLVVGLDVDPEGNVYVADQQAAAIRVYDASGSWLRTIGTSGAGPGELGQAVAGVFVQGEEVHVPDMANLRLQHYSLTGEDGGSQPLDLTAGIPLRWDQLPDGRVVAQRRSAGQGIGTDMESDPVSTLEEEPQTILTLPRGASFDLSGGAPQFRIFESEPIWDVGEDGRIAFGMNADYRIRLHDAEGNLQRIVSVPFTRREVTEGDADRIRSSIANLMADQGVPPAALDQVLAGFQFADFYPAFAQIVVSADGGMWVQQIRVASDVSADSEFNPQDLGSDRWDVFDAEGRYFGQMTLPEKFQPLSFQGDVLYGVQRDEFDVQSIVRYRVTQ